MSRGLGRIERAILDALLPYSKPRSAAEIIRLVAGNEPTLSQRVTIRRAIFALGDKGYLAKSIDAGGAAWVRDKKLGKRIFSVSANSQG